MSTTAAKKTPTTRRLDEIRPSPENDALYRPIDPNDPEIIALAESIAANKVKEPLVITLDGWILSGHRRYAAAKRAGLARVPVRVEPIRRLANRDEFVRLLAVYNQQRVKSFDERLREEAVKVDPDEAYYSLIEHRMQKSDMSDFSGDALEIGHSRGRKGISEAKYLMLKAIRGILEDRRQFWPLSDRQVHYALLNDPPLKHAAKPDSVYANNLQSYKCLTDLLTRARLVGLIPWGAIADETRPFTHWAVHREPGGFIREQLGGLLKGYWRDLQQSQANHIEIVAEKLTVRKIVEDVAMRYCIPVTVGRGYCSIDPRRQMAERFKRSGREALIVLLVSDHDPDGQEIAKSFARSMRDDFHIHDITPIKVALTAEQVREYKLPPSMKAKKSSSNHAKFVSEHGHDAYELEALLPETLQAILASAIDSVLDKEDLSSPIGAFVRECCILGPELKGYIDQLYPAWKKWCDEDGRIAVGDKQTFGRNLGAAVPSIVRQRNHTLGRFWRGIGLRA